MRYSTKMMGVMGVLLAASAGWAWAQEEPESPPRPEVREGPRRGPGLGDLAVWSPRHLIERREVLNLSPEQVAELETLAQAMRDSRDGVAETSREQRERLRELWQEDDPDVAAIRSQAQELMAAENGVRLEMMTTAARAKALLTDEQRGRVEGWLDARRVRARGCAMGGCRGGRAMRRGGGQRRGGVGFRSGPGPRCRHCR